MVEQLERLARGPGQSTSHYADGNGVQLISRVADDYTPPCYLSSLVLYASVYINGDRPTLAIRARSWTASLRSSPPSGVTSGWSAGTAGPPNDAVLTGFMVCGHLWENGFGAAFHPDSTLAGLLHKRSLWDMRSSVFIPPGTEQQTFSASRLFAAVYPEAIDIATILSSPIWRKLAAGDDD